MSVPYFKIVPEVAANLRDMEACRQAIRGYTLHPVTLFVMGFAILLKLVGYMPLEFPVLGLWGDLAFYAARIALYQALALRFMPGFVMALIRRNLPFYLASFLFYAGLLVANYILFHGLMPRGLSVWQEAGRLVGIILFSLFCHSIVMVVVKKDIVRGFAREAALFPFYRPVAAEGRIQPFGSLIDPALTGLVRSLKAQNQYVLVETDGKGGLVRITLREAIGRLPAGSGMQIHRSWWVAQKELERGRIDPPEGLLRTAEGRSYPVGVTYEAELRRCLEAA